MPRLEMSPPPRQRSVIQRAKALPHDLLRKYERLTVKHKAIFWSISAINVLIVIAIILITPRRIGRWFNDFGLKIRGMGVGGMFICGLLIVLSSHPPLFGFSACQGLIGFTFGIWPGFLISSISSMLGAGVAFLSVRTFFPHLLRSNKKWEAFGHVMREKGLPLVVMIRYCPVPWAIGNGLFASVESVKFWHFMLANLAIQPRLLIAVFIGSRLTSLIDPPPDHSDPLRFWLNLGSIVLSLSISTFTGIVIYRLTLEQMRKLEEGNLAAAALEDGGVLGYADNDEEEEVDEEELENEPLTSRQGVRLGRPTNSMLRRTSGSDSGY